MSDKKKKIMIIGIATGVVLAAIIVSAIILFRNDTKKNIHDGGTFTEKITESTTEKKAEVKTTSKATTEKATKATTTKDKKTTATTTETSTKKDGKKPGSPATTEAKTPGREDGKATTSQPVTTERSTTETPTERPTTAATTERPTTEKPKPEPTTTEHVHTWKDVYETQEKKVCVSEAWDEDVQELHSFCSYCGKDITYDGNHIFNCGEKYYSESLGEEIYEGSRAVTRYVTVDTIHHPAEYEIQKEKVFVGRKCSTCGAWQ
jgi:cytoskeletal protein RodZ